MDPVSAAIIGGSSLIGNIGGGLLSSSATSAANSQSVALQQEQLQGGYLPYLVKNAKLAGINPLAVLPGGGGSAGSGISANVGMADALKSSGQDIGRAAASALNKPTKLDLLNEQLVQRKIDQADVDITAGQLRNSQLARTLAATGSPPTYAGVPLPMADPRYDPEIKPELQRFRGTNGIVVGPSAAVQQSLWSPLPGLPANPAVISDVTEANTPGPDPSMRQVFPNVYRAVENLGSWFTGPNVDPTF